MPEKTEVAAWHGLSRSFFFKKAELKLGSGDKGCALRGAEGDGPDGADGRALVEGYDEPGGYGHVDEHTDDVVGDGDKGACGECGVYLEFFKSEGYESAED